MKTRCASSVAGIAMILCLPAIGAAQTAKSAAIAKELLQVLDEKKLDSVAAKTTDPDHFAAALYFPNIQLLVVSGRYTAPQLMEPRLKEKKYRDMYMELSGTVTPDSKIFVQDMGMPGLSQKKQDNMFDTWTQGGKPAVMFDGDPDKQKLTDADYAKMFTVADEAYAKILAALLAEAKR